MTHEATIARAAAVHFESKKTGFGQAQDGWSLTLRIKDIDLPHGVRDAPKGTRYMVALVELNDDETPKIPQEEKPPEKWADLSFVKKAGILCNDKDFIEWTLNDPTGFIYRTCSVTSRKDIDGDIEAERAFKHMENGFRTWQQEKQRGRI